jgi:zinc protease
VSRLGNAIRVEGGLAYSVGSSLIALKSLGLLQISMQTKNETAEEAIRLVRQEIRRMREEGVKQEEVEDATRFLIGNFPLRLDTTARIASYLCETEFYGFGSDYVRTYQERIAGITKEDVESAARKFLDDEKMTVVLVGNLSEVRNRSR